MSAHWGNPDVTPNTLNFRVWPNAAVAIGFASQQDAFSHSASI
jgi:hypothetical protein